MWDYRGLSSLPSSSWSCVFLYFLTKKTSTLLGIIMEVEFTTHCKGNWSSKGCHPHNHEDVQGMFATSSFLLLVAMASNLIAASTVHSFLLYTLVVRPEATDVRSVLAQFASASPPGRDLRAPQARADPTGNFGHAGLRWREQTWSPELDVAGTPGVG